MAEQPAARSLDFLDPRLKALCTAYLQEAQTPGASIAIVAGDRAYHLAYGVKSLRTGEPMTAHTSNLVWCTLISNRPELQNGAIRLRPSGGRLADTTPTMLEIMGYQKPAGMDGESLIERIQK